ncbi:MAG: molybdopterin biosynthesis protein [Nitrospirae bacterium CG_4_10_14_0_8_um_filter_41_23]|nr:molybdopterin biosynthesis protein [Nitrospirota bacterium]OIP58992.1 MAG: molybdopterin biosynthesis protein [Nitrospirae bacterium CG2_30_41_42]PIQ93749.1 MAG: molybdopterin biosynthesis protein [Nitrospirae bacterium CG11_big_fil_rev_8_21_14_0_20_41_14]PIV43507.1 MAG: molybdopterin biosynthesis protein [Nitrospirae bacterium CG02_land_8_20_14_3_00_41_53]PIW88163.1 MAG: molybdopterin biosynthesis protein [Nitrospirae bacterium CG_4_8_14_3_um_filter_41_47]PIY86497.1 MAG: molybdopterin bios
MSPDIYLESTPLHEALTKWLKRLDSEGIVRPLSGETIKVIDSLERVTAEAVIAKISSPFYHSSAMDGYAVRFADTFGVSERTPKRLKIGDQAVYVDTGDPMPEGFNAVIMIEDVNIIKAQSIEHRAQSNDFIEIIAPATPWQHVRVIGEDIVATELILPENHSIRPVDIGAMLAGGHIEVVVRKRPKVVIIPTGTEIVEPGTELKKGDIIEYNSRVLGGLVSEWGGRPVRFRIIPDRIEELKKAILDAHGMGDLIVINAGASAGSEDFTANAINELGEVILHGVSIKPGKPVLMGLIRGKPVLGIPGYPVSAYITFSLFAKPIIYKWQGLEIEEPEILRAKISRQAASTLGQEEFLRVKVGKVGDNFIATPISRGAGVLMSLVRADGFVRIPAMSEGIGAGTEINVELMRSKGDIENTIVCIGSHDNALDLLANILKKTYPMFSLSSAHVGSMGGLLALKKGEAHMAGTHLLDEETGEYNVSFIKRLLPDKNILLINLVYREQGLLVPKGNPKNIKGFEDLIRSDVVFVNRQSGAGTRLLTDKCLRELGITPKDVKGYEREEYTHMGVASAVLTGVADTGLAILASARALNLDFIPIAKERYDLAIPQEFFKAEMLRCLVRIIREDTEFRDMVIRLGGYDISDMGKVMYEG